MNRSHLWKLLLIVFVVVWAIFETTPPTSRDLLREFQRHSRRQDETFSNIVTRAAQMQQEMPNRTFGNLIAAVGTNDIVRYFPQYADKAKGQKDPNLYVLHQIQRESAGRIRLGLDLQGGSSFLVEMDTNQLSRTEEKQTALENAVEVLRKRVDKLGVAEPMLQPQGANQILIQLPGLSESDKQSARETIEKAAFLEFRMVHPDSDAMLTQGYIDPGYEVLRQEIKQEDGKKAVVAYAVSKKPERNLTGKHVKRAMVTRDPVTSQPEIAFELDSEGARIFEEITREYSPKGNKYYHLAIVLDGVLYSAPRIMGPIPGGHGQITGQFDFKEA